MRRRIYWITCEFLKVKEKNKIQKNENKVKKRATKTKVTESKKRRQIGRKSYKKKAKRGIKPSVMPRSE